MPFIQWNQQILRNSFSYNRYLQQTLSCLIIIKTFLHASLTLVVYAVNSFRLRCQICQSEGHNLILSVNYQVFIIYILQCYGKLLVWYFTMEPNRFNVSTIDICIVWPPEGVLQILCGSLWLGCHKCKRRIEQNRVEHKQ